MIQTTNSYKSKTYVGYSTNPQKRLLTHNSNKGAKSTKGHNWKIIYIKEFNTKSEALSYEYNLKRDKKKRDYIKTK